MDSFFEAKSKFRERSASRMEERLENAGICSGLFDCDCLGASTRVLTDNGWKRIVEVSKGDRLWDGEEWVGHSGLAYRGESETIDFRGIAITSDHKVLTLEGSWVEAKDADADNVVVTGDPSTVEAHHAIGRQPVYDLLDAGPRNRFTVCGADGVPFIVHNCACADYSGVAAASSQANAISEKLGTDQLNEAKRQYDLNMEVAKPVVDAQLEQMRANTEQAKDYYDNWKTTYQPLEQGLVEDVNKASDPDYIESKANTAMADARQGTTQQQNQLIRQGLRYGYSPSHLAAMAGSSATQTGLGIASAANQARDKATDTAYAKKLDVAGLGRGLTGAANGAYTSALNAGNSAVGNNAQAGNALLNGMAQGTGTIQNGLGMQINGLLGAANGVQSGYNNSGGDSGLGGLGSLLGGAASFAKVAGWS